MVLAVKQTLEGIRINTEWLDGVGITYRTHVQKLVGKIGYQTES